VGLELSGLVPSARFAKKTETCITQGMNLAIVNPYAKYNPKGMIHVMCNEPLNVIILDDPPEELIRKHNPPPKVQLSKKETTRLNQATTFFQNGKYIEALKMLCSDTLIPPRGEARALLKKIEEKGHYDFKRMQEEGKQMDYSAGLDHANYSGNFKVVNIPGKGKGMRATADLNPGQIILVHKAFAIIGLPELGDLLTKLTNPNPQRSDRMQIQIALLLFTLQVARIMQKLIIEPKNIELINQLHPREYPEPPGYYSAPEQLARRLKMNSYDIGNSALGFWASDAAFVNHSCLPNASKCFLGILCAC